MSNSTQSTIPKVVLLGRTNAGKSTLFNRLTEHGKAIISPVENTTRDQNRDVVYWKGFMCELIDTGGLDTTAYDALDQEIQQQVQRAVAEADAIIFLVDGLGALMPQDRQVADWLRTLSVPIILCVNKMDNAKLRVIAEAEFAPLHMEPLLFCSAKNGTGTAELLDAVFERISHVTAPETSTETEYIDIALVGRPNVGKSSLFNALVGEERVIVSEIAHTTRDINDTYLEFQDRQIRLIDTAGIRRKNQVGQWKGSGAKAGYYARIERQGVKAALDNVDRADIVVLVLEAQKRVSNQDKTLVDFAIHHGKGLLIVINKWDLIPDKDPVTMNSYIEYFSELLHFPLHTPVIFTSAVDKQRVQDILKKSVQVYDVRASWAPHEQLATALQAVMKTKPWQKTRRGRDQHRVALDLRSLIQTEINPPRFKLISPTPKEIAGPLYNILEKEIRKQCGFDGVSIIIDVDRPKSSKD